MKVKAEIEEIIQSFKYIFGLDHQYSYLTYDMRKKLERVLNKIVQEKLAPLTQQLSSFLSTLKYDQYELENILSEEFIKVLLQLIFKKDFSSNPENLIDIFCIFFRDLEEIYWCIVEAPKDTPAGPMSEEDCYSMIIPTLEITQNGDFRFNSDTVFLDWFLKDLIEHLRPLAILSPIKTQKSTNYPYQRTHSLLFEKSILRGKSKQESEKPKIEKKPSKRLKQISLFGDDVSDKEVEKSQRRVEKRLIVKIKEEELVETILDLIRRRSDFFQLSNDEKVIKIRNKVQNSDPILYPLIRKFLKKLDYLNKFKDKPQMELFQRLEKRYSDLSNFILKEYEPNSVGSFKRLTTILQILIDLTKNYNQYFTDHYIRNYIADIRLYIRENRIYMASRILGKDYKFPIDLKELTNQVSKERYKWFMFIYYREY